LWCEATFAAFRLAKWVRLPLSCVALVSHKRNFSAACLIAACITTSATSATSAQANPVAADTEHKNWLGDPFEQVTRGYPACPEPLGPRMTEAQKNDSLVSQTHARAERGTRCHQEGRCRLPNSFMYDKHIMAEIAPKLRADRSLASSSLWLTGQRRWVFLQGCATPAQTRRAEALIRAQPDVELVITETWAPVTPGPSHSRKGTVPRTLAPYRLLPVPPMR
jgi:hypothetical protein